MTVALFGDVQLKSRFAVPLNRTLSPTICVHPEPEVRALPRKSTTSAGVSGAARAVRGSPCAPLVPLQEPSQEVATDAADALLLALLCEAGGLEHAVGQA